MEKEGNLNIEFTENTRLLLHHDKERESSIDLPYWFTDLCDEQSATLSSVVSDIKISPRHDNMQYKVQAEIAPVSKITEFCKHMNVMNGVVFIPEPWAIPTQLYSSTRLSPGFYINRISDNRKKVIHCKKLLQSLDRKGIKYDTDKLIKDGVVEIEERETIIAFSSLPLSYKDTLKTTIPVFRVKLDILKEFEGQILNISGLGNNGIVKLELNSMFISVPVFFLNKIYLSDGN